MTHISNIFLSLVNNVNPGPAEPGVYHAFANSIGPDQLASEKAN